MLGAYASSSTEHWRSYIKTACDIGLPVMLFVQVLHKAGSSSQVPVSDAHQGEAEVQTGDGPATSHKKKEKDMVRKKKDVVTHTWRVQLMRGKLMKNYSDGLKWRPTGMNVDWKKTPQMMKMTR
jgi:hypothetical protein